jgi:predicted deacylase
VCPRPLGPYPSPDEREARIDELAASLDADVVHYGRSVRGAPLRAVRVPCRGGPETPRVLCSANIHGPELVGAAVALGLLEQLVAGEAAAAELRDRAEVWVVPCINPDGYARTWARSGRGTLAELRTNERGVDLNRNYPMPGAATPRRLPGAGSSRRGDATFRGPSPLSEPETRALHELCLAQRFHASANMHSFMGTIIPSRVTDPATYETYRSLCGAFRAAQPRHRYRRMASRVFDVFTGEQEDHQHHALGTWAVCIETFSVLASYRQHLRAPSLFWRFNPRDPHPWIDNDVPGILAFFLAALERPRAQ